MLLGNCSSTLEQDNAVSCNLKIKKVVKILGVHFTYDLRAKQKLNVDELIRSIQQKLRIWRWRDLTIIGRIQIVTTFITDFYFPVPREFDMGFISSQACSFCGEIPGALFHLLSLY